MKYIVESINNNKARIMAPALDQKGERIKALLQDIKKIPSITDCANTF